MTGVVALALFFALASDHGDGPSPAVDEGKRILVPYFGKVDAGELATAVKQLETREANRVRARARMEARKSAGK